VEEGGLLMAKQLCQLGLARTSHIMEQNLQGTRDSIYKSCRVLVVLTWPSATVYSY
jgi:hypothetical protein